MVIAYLEGLHASDPDAADISSELAWNLCRLLPEGDATRAVAVARLAVDQRSDVRDYQQVLAIALYHAEEFAECVEILTRLSDDGETALLGLMRAIALHELGDEETAELLGRHMLRELGENPNNITRSVVSRAQELFH